TGIGAGSNSSSSSSSSSSGNNGESIPLDQLCPVLAKGYLRYYTYNFYGGAGADPTFPISCDHAISDDELLTLLWGDLDQNYDALCSPDGGLIFVTTQDISRAVSQGR